MNDENLTAYLNDHLAGSVAVIGLMEHWRSIEIDAGIAAVVDGLLRDVREDQAVLREVLERVGGSEDAVKKSAAWLGEKAGRIKFAAAGATLAAWAFYRLEQFDALRVGINGKLALWEAMGASCAGDARLDGRFDWVELERRALEQIARLNGPRLAAARVAFGA